MKYYYELHCFFDRNNGYSIFIETDHQMNDEDLIKWCTENNKFEEPHDGLYVDYIQPITEEEYKEVTL